MRPADPVAAIEVVPATADRWDDVVTSACPAVPDAGGGREARR